MASLAGGADDDGAVAAADDGGDGGGGDGADVVVVDVVVAVAVVVGDSGSDTVAAVVAAIDFTAVFAVPEASSHSFRILLSRFKTSALALGTLQTPSVQSAPAGGELFNAYIAPPGLRAIPVLTSSNVVMTESIRTIAICARTQPFHAKFMCIHCCISDVSNVKIDGQEMLFFLAGSLSEKTKGTKNWGYLTVVIALDLSRERSRERWEMGDGRWNKSTKTTQWASCKS